MLESLYAVSPFVATMMPVLAALACVFCIEVTHSCKTDEIGAFCTFTLLAVLTGTLAARGFIYLIAMEL